MSLKQIIKRSRILHPATDNELVLPGEPMIYSLKYPVGKRVRGVQFFRNMKWKSLLKCFFRSFYRTDTPVVLKIAFYVSPPEHIKVSEKQLRTETTPAVFSFELCDYILSFMEMLHHVLINSYKQIVKLDVEKFYSKEPRTVFTFMSWEEHVKLQSNNPLNTVSKSLSPPWKTRGVQPKREGDAPDEGVCQGPVEGCEVTSSEGTSPCDRPLCSPSSLKPSTKKTRTAKLPTSCKETRRGQPGEISK